MQIGLVYLLDVSALTVYRLSHTSYGSLSSSYCLRLQFYLKSCISSPDRLPSSSPSAEKPSSRFATFLFLLRNMNHTAGPSRPGDPPTNKRMQQQAESKTVTCVYWANGKCNKSETSCPYAHHLFPVIMERNARQGSKFVACKYKGTEEGCFWPAEVCAYSHQSNHDEETD